MMSVILIISVSGDMDYKSHLFIFLFVFYLKIETNYCLIATDLYSKVVVPNILGIRDQFHGRQFFHGPG